MGIQLDLAKRLQRDFHQFRASTLDRESTLDLLELVMDLTAQGI